MGAKGKRLQEAVLASVRGLSLVGSQLFDQELLQLLLTELKALTELVCRACTLLGAVSHPPMNPAQPRLADVPAEHWTWAEHRKVGGVCFRQPAGRQPFRV